MNYLVRRLFACGWQLVAASMLSFLLFSILPGTLYTIERMDPQRSSQFVDQLEKDAGLREPWPRRYGGWVSSCFHGDCGTSLSYGVPVLRLIGPRLSNTFRIALPGLLLAWLLGTGLALATAVLWRPMVALEPAAASVGMVPDVISIGVLLWLGVKLGLPITGPGLPILGLLISLCPVIFLHASSSLDAARNLPFVRLARQRGMAEQRLWLRYVAPAAASPLVTLGGLSIAAAIGSSLIVEVLTGWPGLGPLFLEAVQARDYAVVQTVVVLLAAILAVSNLIADLILYRIDPRIRVPR